MWTAQPVTESIVLSSRSCAMMCAVCRLSPSSGASNARARFDVGESGWFVTGTPITPTTVSPERSGKVAHSPAASINGCSEGGSPVTGAAIILRRPPMLVSIQSWSTPRIDGSLLAIVS